MRVKTALFRRMTGRGALALVLFAAGLAPSARATHPSPLPDTITTPLGYTVHYTNDKPWTAPLGPGDDRNWFPTSQAQNVADALDNAGASVLGAPNGYHAGYVDLGFGTPDFDGSDRDAFVFDCDAHGGCDSGNAPADRINLPTANARMYVTATEPCLRLVMGHELFHHVQYDYITFDKWSSWGTMPVEGTARMMQDKIYSDLDGDAGCITYRSQVTNYMDDPNRTLWDLSYTSALFWAYAAEQLGGTPGEPVLGTDFIRRFWQNAEANNDDPNTPATLRETIHDFDSGLSLEELFHRFSIANIAREFDVSLVPDAIRYLYRDESDGVSGAYQDVARTWTGAINTGSVGPNATDVVSLGARYFEADVGADCRGIVGYVAEGDRAGHGLLTVDASGRVLGVHKGRTEKFARSFIQRLDPSERIAKLVATAAGTDGDADFEFSFACGQPSLTIVRPDASFMAYVGEHDDPEKFMIRLIVTGPSVLGTPTVFGLDPSDFDVYVGPVDPANQATVLSGANVQGEYWLVVQAPEKPANALFDLTVVLGDYTQDTNVSSVLYEKRLLDQVVVIDRSGSMLSPAGSPKLDAVKNAAPLYVDAASDDDLIGLVSFGGDNSEPNDDAILESLMRPASTPGHRDLTKNKAAGLSTFPNVLTSIGDGLEKARQEFVVRGTALGEDWIILLSDGMENEGLFYANVKAALQADGIKVHTIALGPQSDQALLQQIASDTGGTYYYVEEGSAATAARAEPSLLQLALSWLDVGTADAAGIGSFIALPNRLADTYAAAYEASHNSDRLWEAEATVAPGGTIFHTIPVGEAGLVEGRLMFNWDDPGDKIAVSVEDPFGNPVVDGVGGVRVYETTTHVEYHLPAVTDGDWTVRIDGLAGSTDYVGILSGRINFGVALEVLLAGGIDPNVVAQGGTFAWGQPMPLLAILTDSKGPIAGADVVAEVRHPDGAVDVLPLFDDGAHDDGEADDGVYGNLYRRTTQASPTHQPDGPNTPAIVGSYPVRVEAHGISNRSEAFDRIGKRAFQVFEIRDPDADFDGDGMPDVYEDANECLKWNSADDGKDPDEDGLLNVEEWKAGTDPCNADTDFGGEMDSSEIARGANPLDPADDALPAPEGPEVIDWVPDHQPAIQLQPNENRLRYPSHPTWQQVRIWRSLSPTGPFGILADVTPDGTGQYVDPGLVNGTTYYYRLQGLGLSGERSDYSEVFSGTPKADPMSTPGTLRILDGEYTESLTVKLALGTDASDTTEMQISNDASFPGAPWIPFADTHSWGIAPDPATGVATVFARFRDAAQNVSTTYADEITVVPPGTLGAITGTVLLSGAPIHTGVLLELLGTDVSPDVSDAIGALAVSNLHPGTYDLRLSKDGYATVELPGIVVPPGTTVDLGTIALPEPGWPALAAGLMGLRWLASRGRRSRSGPMPPPAA